MNNYIKVTFAVTPAEEAAADVLAALLADVGFESFVPEETGMAAYAPVALYDADAVAQVVEAFPLEGFSITDTAPQMPGETAKSQRTKIQNNLPGALNPQGWLSPASIYRVY